MGIYFRGSGARIPRTWRTLSQYSSCEGCAGGQRSFQRISRDSLRRCPALLTSRLVQEHRSESGGDRCDPNEQRHRQRACTLISFPGSCSSKGLRVVAENLNVDDPTLALDVRARPQLDRNISLSYAYSDLGVVWQYGTSLMARP